MTTVVLIATAWGPAFGGVNAFNEDLAAGLAAVLPSGRVVCLLPGLDPGEAEKARKVGVELLVVPNLKRGDRMPAALVRDVSPDLAAEADGDIFWIGHDVVTGPLALACADAFGGRAALIHHMHYADYAVLHNPDVEADRKAQDQRTLFTGAERAALFGVGPLLTERCVSMTGRPDVVELIPGFLTGHQAQSRPQEDKTPLQALTFGRMDTAEDRLKNGRLAVAAFATAIAAAASDPVARDLRLVRGSRFTLVGVDPTQDVSELKSLAASIADRFVNLFALPYDEDRDALKQRLREANLSLMLSWHEGFGLTGWEAIAFGVPLIVSEQSGLYRLIDAQLGPSGLALVKPIDVRNPRNEDEPFHPDDLTSVATAIQQVSRGLPQHLKNARQLREMLIAHCGCAWTDTAQALLRGLGVGDGDLSIDDPAPPDTLSSPARSRRNEALILRRIILAVYDGSHLVRGFRIEPGWTQLLAFIPEPVFDQLKPHIEGAPPLDRVLEIAAREGLTSFFLDQVLLRIAEDWSRLHPAARLRLKGLAEAGDLPEIVALPALSDGETRLATVPWRKADRILASRLSAWLEKLGQIGIDVEAKQVDWGLFFQDQARTRACVLGGVTEQISVDVALAEHWLESDPERLAPAISLRAADLAERALSVVRENLPGLMEAPEAQLQAYQALVAAVRTVTENPFLVPPGPVWEALQAR